MAIQHNTHISTQLMQVAEKFSNHKSTYDLPSSAQVLALLAASDADDATVQQAAEENWTACSDSSEGS